MKKKSKSKPSDKPALTSSSTLIVVIMVVAVSCAFTMLLVKLAVIQDTSDQIYIQPADAVSGKGSELHAVHGAPDSSAWVEMREERNDGTIKAELWRYPCKEITEKCLITQHEFDSVCGEFYWHVGSTFIYVGKRKNNCKASLSDFDSGSYYDLEGNIVTVITMGPDKETLKYWRNGYTSDVQVSQVTVGGCVEYGEGFPGTTQLKSLVVTDTYNKISQTINLPKLLQVKCWGPDDHPDIGYPSYANGILSFDIGNLGMDLGEQEPDWENIMSVRINTKKSLQNAVSISAPDPKY